ncbi:MAG: bifunctional UDP-3-O-[3-hydroxymyristoyl] N-acetylglucosamine deacetylase/3-hydroxyacyl-ACP dehydratase [Endomicrobium sp.]|jgi:UDP-3-O-[3-hydroxymyristoyl] N-acetylglucosamine deacetylase/3-hydroxyacyl-[acyl-carrier-protein] dehydratase|nr:bifunctional UDP-3-O-[3-hydroxymyristoyl] N-acetylglucosamine deacetylase/3-hydroxyacyl-ACP dehydratase [Endomicrobium sp.]
MAKQTTILKEVSVEGIGLHTGNKSVIIFKPAPDSGYGIKFIRTDLPGNPVVEALLSNTIAGSAVRGTVIEKNGIKIHTIEHIMSACFALGIDNLIIELSNSEPPILDGSAKIFTEILLNGGLKEFSAVKEYYVLKESVYFESGKTKIFAQPSEQLEIECTIGFDHPFLRFQKMILKNLDKNFYLTHIASAKTFCFDYEIEVLQKKGLALGGSMDNAIVIALNGIHNKEPLRYKDEFVRHKILDLIGDLYLAGRPIKAKIIADKPGHNNNINFVKEFLKKAVVEKDEIANNITDKSTMNLSFIETETETEKILGLEEILNYIPHRYPFLMIDKVKINVASPLKAIGYKCVSANENFFQGHFPGFPIMPGVLIIEAMAQTSCVMFLSRPKLRGCLAYFTSIDKAKFRRPVKPGDVLELKVEVLKDSGRRGKMKGEAYVDGKLTAEAEFMFVIVDKVDRNKVASES